MNKDTGSDSSKNTGAAAEADVGEDANAGQHSSGSGEHADGDKFGIDDSCIGKDVEVSVAGGDRPVCGRLDETEGACLRVRGSLGETHIPWRAVIAILVYP